MRIWLSTDAANDWYFAGFAALSFAEIIITCANGAQYLKQIVPKSSAELHSRLLQTVMEATLSYISHTDAGSMLNRFSQDISLISQRMPLMLMTTVSMFFNVLVDMGIIASGAKFTPPIILFLFGILYGIQYFYLRTSRQLRYLELETTAPLVSHFTETSLGMAHIRGLRWQRYYHKELIARLDHSQHPFFYLLCIQQWLTLALDFMTFVSAVTLISITMVLPGSSSESAIGLALLNLISFSTTASYFLQMWVHLETSLGGLARIQSFCEDTPVEKDCEDMPALPDNWPSSGKIDFNCVTAKYMYVDTAYTSSYLSAYTNTDQRTTGRDSQGAREYDCQYSAWPKSQHKRPNWKVIYRRVMPPKPTPAYKRLQWKNIHDACAAEFDGVLWQHQYRRPFDQDDSAACSTIEYNNNDPRRRRIEGNNPHECLSVFSYAPCRPGNHRDP